MRFARLLGLLTTASLLLPGAAAATLDGQETTAQTQGECDGTVGSLLCQARCTAENNYYNARNGASNLVYGALQTHAPLVIQLTGMTNPIDEWAYGKARGIVPLLPPENPARPQPC